MATTYTLLSDPSDKFEVVGSELRLRNKLLTGTSATALIRRDVDGVITNLAVEVDSLNVIREINKTIAGFTPQVPQTFYNFTATEAADPLVHPSMGTATHTAVKTGLWSDPTTWDTGTLPGANSIVKVDDGFTVTYDVESTALIGAISTHHGGNLKWITTRDTLLCVGTIQSHGKFEIEDFAESAIAGKARHRIWFGSDDAPLTTTKLGLVCMGPTRIVGADKEDRLFSGANIPAGATSCVLEGLAQANWRAGDQILFVATTRAGTTSTDTQYTGPTQYWGPINDTNGQITRGSNYRLSHDEARIIDTLDETTGVVTWSTPLVYNHNVYTRTSAHRGTAMTAKPAVANRSKSIELRTLGGQAGDTAIWPNANLTVLQKRAHSMFMHHDDVQIRGTRFRDMGRTDTNPSLVRPGGEITRATDGGTSIIDPNNVRGRYPIHVHGTGPFFGRRQLIVDRNVVDTTDGAVPIPGWGITHHNCRAAIDRNLVYNVRGAGIVTELGNEIGQWIGNTVCWVRGDGFPGPGWGTRQERWENQNGSSGVGYESQARHILSNGNIASSCNQAWVFMQQNVNALARIPDKLSRRAVDPIAQGGQQGLLEYGGVTAYAFDNETDGIEQSQIVDYHDNISFNCGTGFFVAHRQFSDRGEATPMIAKGNHCINCDMPFNLQNYSFYYSFYYFMWVRDSLVAGSIAAICGDNTSEMNFVDGVIENFETGFVDNGLGHNYHGFWIDLDFRNVTTPFPNTTLQTNNTGTDPTAHLLYGVMGPWTNITIGTPAGGYTARTRTWANLLSTELPSPYPTAPVGFGGVEPSAGTPKPYFWLDPTSDLTLEMAGYNSISLKGAIVDEVGIRRWPSLFTGTLNSPVTMSPRTNHHTTGAQIVEKNGCFLDGSTWKSRLWFISSERKTGDYFTFFIDVTLSGGTTQFYEANVNLKYDVPPSLPLLPEHTPYKSLKADTQAPVIVTSAVQAVPEEEKLAITLLAKEIHPKWSIDGGPDAGLVMVDTAVTPKVVRWTSDGTQVYSPAADANGDNVFQFNVRCEDYFGNFSVLPVVLTQTPALTTFSDNFDGTDGQFLEDRAGWTLVSGVAGGARISGNRISFVTPVLVKTGSLGSANHGVSVNFNGSAEDAGVALRVTDANNLVRLIKHWTSTVWVEIVVGGTVTQTIKYGNNGAALVAVELNGSTVAVKFNGVVQTPTEGSQTITSGPPLAKATGVFLRTTSARNNLIDNFTAYRLV